MHKALASGADAIVLDLESTVPRGEATVARRMVRALVELLFADPKVTRIQTDPAPSNHRAIRCYEKAGFVRERVIATPDGPAVYMTQTRQAFERAVGAA